MKLIDVDVYQLEEKLKKKKIVCFGAGKGMHSFFAFYDRFHFEEKILFILDNNEEKRGMPISIKDHWWNVLSISDFLSQYPDDEFIILITCADIVSVYEQLQHLSILENVEGCSTLFIKCATHEKEEQNRYYPDNFRLSDVPMIPKVIHYCWFGGKPIPEKNVQWMNSWKKYCPDFEIVCWNESNYDISQNKFMCQAYKAGKWGFVPDYARLDIIYRYGGIYLDTDVELIAKLDELLYQPAFAGVDGSGRVSLGLGFGAVRGCPIIGELRDQYSQIEFYDEKGNERMVSAPTLQKPFFTKKGYANEGEFQIIDDLTIYPEKVLSAKCNITGMILPTNRTIAIHHYDGSWNNEEKAAGIRKLHKLFREEVTA